MNWKQILLNVFGVFAAAYGAAISSGQSPKAAATIGGIAVLSNASGLFQAQPHKP